MTEPAAASPSSSPLRNSWPSPAADSARPLPPVDAAKAYVPAEEGGRK